MKQHSVFEYENQNYDFEKSREFIEENGYHHFKLHEFRGNLNENRLFEYNIFSEELKFKPDDEPRTYHKIIGKEGRKFHEKYWKYISKTIKKAGR